MTARLFEIQQSGRLHALESGAFAEEVAAAAKSELDSQTLAQADPERPYLWVDLVGERQEEIAKWLKWAGVRTFVQDLALGSITDGLLETQSSLNVVSEEGAYFFFPFYGNDDLDVPERITGVCAPRVLITIHDAEFPNLQAAQEWAQQGDLIASPTPSGVVASLLRYASSCATDAATRLRRRSKGISHALSEGNESGRFSEIVALDEAIDTLSATVSEMIVTTRGLSVSATDTLNLDRLARHIHVTVTNLEMLARVLDRMDRHVDSLRSQYDSRLSERTNRRLATLTVLSAVFMPLTLIAGIYGMNFDDMPELHAPAAYPIVMTLMASIALVMTLFFYKRGWFQ